MAVGCLAGLARRAPTAGIAWGQAASGSGAIFGEIPSSEHCVLRLDEAAIAPEDSSDRKLHAVVCRADHRSGEDGTFAFRADIARAAPAGTSVAEPRSRRSCPHVAGLEESRRRHPRIDRTPLAASRTLPPASPIAAQDLADLEAEVARDPESNVQFRNFPAHTDWPFDAVTKDAVPGPDEASRGARNAPTAVGWGSDATIKVKMPLDWYGVFNHAEYLGIVPKTAEPGNPLGQVPVAKLATFMEPAEGCEGSKVILGQISTQPAHRHAGRPATRRPTRSRCATTCPPRSRTARGPHRSRRSPQS